MTVFGQRILCFAAFAALGTWLFAAKITAQTAAKRAPIPVKVVVVAMFEPGEDTGDTPGEYQLWVEREHLDRIIDVPGAYHHVRLNKDGVLGMLTGVATAKAAASVMAVGLDPRFDLSKAYWIVAGIGGGDPADVSLGSAVWADRVLDTDIAYEVDAREIPSNWATGMIPLRRATPYEEPPKPDNGEIYTLNTSLAHWAFELTRNVPLADDDRIRAYRSRYANFPNAMKPPFVTEGDAASGSTFWHGAYLDQWANEWDRYFTTGKGNFMIAGMEDTGTLQSLTLLARAKRVDINRVLVLRTVSNYDQQPAGTNVADSLKDLAAGNYSAYMPSLEAAQKIGDKVVRDIVEHWDQRKQQTPHSP